MNAQLAKQYSNNAQIYIYFIFLCSSFTVRNKRPNPLFTTVSNDITTYIRTFLNIIFNCAKYRKNIQQKQFFVFYFK